VPFSLALLVRTLRSVLPALISVLIRVVGIVLLLGRGVEERIQRVLDLRHQTLAFIAARWAAAHLLILAVSLWRAAAGVRSLVLISLVIAVIHGIALLRR